MDEDELLLLACYIIYGLTLALLLIMSRRRKRVALINGCILALYSMPLLYNLEYNSKGGSGLLWIFYLFAALALQWLVNLGMLIALLLKNKDMPRM